MKKILILITLLTLVILIGALNFINKDLSPEDNKAMEEEFVFPEPGTKLAFVGDTGMGTDYKKVLELIKQEDADAIVHLGDFDYARNPQGFNNVINGVFGEDYPYLVVSGNHDKPIWNPNCNNDKGCYSEIFAERYETAGIPISLEMLVSETYQLDFQGIQLLFIGPGGEKKSTEYSSFLNTQLSQSNNLWKICNWHFNQQVLQLGTKEDQTGWGVYDECLNAGAIIATAHEHSYHRTKSLVDFHSQQFPIVNSLFPEPDALAIYPGSTFVFVSGLGGKSIRNQDRCLPTLYPYGCSQEWASIYTSNQNANHGSLFLEFNINGDPHQAKGYFKNIDNQIIDEFEITNQTILSDITPITTDIPQNSPTVSITSSTIPSPAVTYVIPEQTPEATVVVPTGYNSPLPTSVPDGMVCGKADVDGNGKFTVFEFSEFAQSYGTGKNICSDTSVDYGPCGGKDVNRDGKLNIADFGAEGIGFAQRYYPKQSCVI